MIWDVKVVLGKIIRGKVQKAPVCILCIDAMMRGMKEEGSSSSSSSKLHKPKGASAASSSAAAMVGGEGAAKYLSNLPSRGLFSYSPNAPTNLDRMRVCICEHDTSPPDGQLIKTNQTNILIRALLQKKQKSDSVSKDAKGKATVENGKGKRAADRPADGRIATKKANTASESRNSQPNGSSSRTAEKDFQSLTVERLRAMLKERGMSTKGRKDELIARLKAGELMNHS